MASTTRLATSVHCAPRRPRSSANTARHQQQEEARRKAGLSLSAHLRIGALLTVSRSLKGGDVDLAHLEHRVRGSPRPRGILVTQQIHEGRRDDLPREAELVLQPAALALLAPVRG